jgi:transglutaminase-like putative cysteine protease
MINPMPPMPPMPPMVPLPPMPPLPPAPPVRWLRVRHDTTYDYDAPVELAHHVAFLGPRATPLQQVRDWSLAITPLPDEWMDLGPSQGPQRIPQRQLSLDAWGNSRVAFSHSRVHEQLVVRSQFEAGVRVGPVVDPDRSAAWEAVAQSLNYRAGAARTDAVEFRLPSRFVPLTPALAAFGQEAFTPGRPLAAGALALMNLIHTQFAYQPASTSVGTGAVEALALRRGVCQDFAHVLIGACRSLGLSARYVSGYLLTQPPPGKPRLVGADASHAWAEVWCPVQGWLALDPTNNVVAGMDHVTLGWGRDYADVAPLRGVIRGGAAEPHVEVTVAPLDEAESLIGPASVDPTAPGLNPTGSGFATPGGPCKAPGIP